ncbi:hypothetical protein HDU88_002174 [Geranomyces variabilis]|nr:hypothetical protein HDU88_002174 [Geranomyces variabilis]
MPSPRQKAAASSHDTDDADHSSASAELAIEDPQFTSDFEQLTSTSPPHEGISDSCKIKDPVFTSDFEPFESEEVESANLSIVQGLPHDTDRLSSAISAVSAILAVKTPDFSSDFEQLNSEFDSANDENDESAEIEKVFHTQGALKGGNSHANSADESSRADCAAAIPAIQDPTFSSTSSHPSGKQDDTDNALSESSSEIPSILNPVFSSDFELLQAENLENQSATSTNQDVTSIHAEEVIGRDGQLDAKSHSIEAVSSGCAEELYDDEFEAYSKASSKGEDETSRSAQLRPAHSVERSSIASSSGSCTSHRHSSNPEGEMPSNSDAPSKSAGSCTRSDVWDADREIAKYESAAETMYARLRDAIIKSTVPRPVDDKAKPEQAKRDPALDALRSRLAKNTQHLQSPPPPPATQLPSKWLHRLRWQNVLRTLDGPIINTPGSPLLSNAKIEEQALEKSLLSLTAALNKKTAEEYARAPPPDAIEMIAEIARGMPRTGSGPSVWEIYRARERNNLTANVV